MTVRIKLEEMRDWVRFADYADCQSPDVWTSPVLTSRATDKERHVVEAQSQEAIPASLEQALGFVGV